MIEEVTEMSFSSSLESYRLKYKPALPSILKDLVHLVPVQEISSTEKEVNDELSKTFPKTINLPILSFKKGQAYSSEPIKVGVVFSGGQAPGGHNVISGLFDALKQINPDSQLIGFLNGPDGIIKNKFVPLTEEKIAPYRNLGGFDMIGSGRTKIESPDQFEASAKTLNDHQLDGLVFIGGDDTNTNAAFLAEFCLQKGIKTRIIGVPKTIDGDLKNEFIEISFGFDTASKIYSEIIGNLLKDALSAKKYYFFVKLMGRSASHLTLETALQTHVNMAIISEEIQACKYTLHDIVNQISDLISKRADQGKNYGVILIPEGLLEFIPECKKLLNELNRLVSAESSVRWTNSSFKEQMDFLKSSLSQESMECFLQFPEDIQKQLLLDRDPHGNIQVSKIETERLFITLVERELKQQELKGRFKGKFNPQPLFCGYEGRSGFPSNFDCQYCYALGFLAVLLIQSKATGYICSIKNLSRDKAQWEIFGVPIVNMLNFEERKNKKQAVIKKALVDLNGAPFNELKRHRDNWGLKDEYSCPGPIQFDGPKELTERIPLTLLYETQNRL